MSWSLGPSANSPSPTASRSLAVATDCRLSRAIDGCLACCCRPCGRPAAGDLRPFFPPGEKSPQQGGLEGCTAWMKCQWHHVCSGGSFPCLDEARGRGGKRNGRPRTTNYRYDAGPNSAMRAEIRQIVVNHSLCDEPLMRIFGFLSGLRADTQSVVVESLRLRSTSLAATVTKLLETSPLPIDIPERLNVALSTFKKMTAQRNKIVHW